MNDDKLTKEILDALEDLIVTHIQMIMAKGNIVLSKQEAKNILRHLSKKILLEYV